MSKLESIKCVKTAYYIIASSTISDRTLNVCGNCHVMGDVRHCVRNSSSVLISGDGQNVGTRKRRKTTRRLTHTLIYC